MTELLQENPLLLLFIVAALGYFVGQVKIKGSGLGVAAVLFVGLAFGALNLKYQAAEMEIVFQLGLVLFVYSVGLSSGPAFFQAFKKNGIRDMSFVMVMLTFSALIAVALYYLMGFDAETTVGIYSGSTTNTPALASVIDVVNASSAANKDSLVQHMVVGYTYSYPMGVLGVMVAIKIMERIFKVDYEAEKLQLKDQYPIDEELSSRYILVNNEAVFGKQLRDIRRDHRLKVVFGRVDRKDGDIMLPNWDTIFESGDRILIVGSKSDMDAATDIFGLEVEDKLIYNRKDYDVRQIFVSNPRVVGKDISSLNLDANYQAIITRIRRGDIDMLAHGHTVLEMGDRVRFVARRKDLKALSKLFGDSYAATGQVDLFSFGLGIALGLILGTISFTLPGGVSFKLGAAGGPLIVGLILGALRRTGPVVWTLPYGANLTLRQIGLILLLAVIGLKSGNTFFESLSQGGWVPIFIGGTLLSTLAAIISIWFGHKISKIPFSLLLGFMSNQPAILEFSMNMSKNRIPLIGYSLMFPIALVMKILFAQLLYIIL